MATSFIDQVIHDLVERVVVEHPEDLPSLTESDREVHAWELVLRRVERGLLASRRHRNAQTLINSMPLEIVLLILMEAMEDFRKTRDYYEKLFRLRSVCSAWMSCIDDHSQFWTLVFPQSSRLLDDVTTPRARNLPLELHYPLYTGMAYRQEKCEQLLARLEERHWPLRMFHFYDPNSRYSGNYPLLESFLASPAPDLRSLELTTLTSRRVLDTLFSGHAPVLRRAHLAYVTLNSTTQPFANLQQLELVEVHGLTTSKLLHLLSHCGNLRHLAITALQYDDTSLSSPPATASLSLPQLQILEVDRMDAEAITPLLEALSFSNATRIHLNLREDSVGLKALFNLVQSSLPTSRGVHVAQRTVGRFHHVTLRGDNWDIVAHSTETITPESSVSLLTTHIPIPDAIRTATLSFGISEILDGERIVLEAINSLFPSLQELVFEEYTRDLGEVLSEHLGSKRDGDTKWTFPGLKTIRITAMSDVTEALHALGTVIKLVEGRRDGQAPASITLSDFKFGDILEDAAVELTGLVDQLRQLVPVVEVEYEVDEGN